MTGKGKKTEEKKLKYTPGLTHILKEKVRLAGKVLADGEFPVLVRGLPRTGKTHIRNNILKASKLDKLGAEGKSEELGGEGVLNCAAIPENLADSILFGHKQGSFTGADEHRNGLLLDESNPPKVILLEEIGELPKHVQAKLLVFFDNRSVRPVGANWGEEKKSTLRIIATSNAEDKKFRPDFLARLWAISVPPIHERREDILYFLNLFLKVDEQKFSASELFALMTYHWPGEVTEIKKVCIQIDYHCLPIEISQRFGLVAKLILNDASWEGWCAYSAFCFHHIRAKLDDTIKQLFPHFYIDAFDEDPALSYKWQELAREWEAWCYFFGHDPKAPFNILEKLGESEPRPASETQLFPWTESDCDIDERYASRPQLEYFIDFLTSIKLWNDEGRLLLNNLRSKAFGDFYDGFYRPGKNEENNKGSKELPVSEQITPVIFEQVNPKQYENLFWEHQKKQNRTGREIEEKYEINRVTANRHIRNRKNKS